MLTLGIIIFVIFVISAVKGVPFELSDPTGLTLLIIWIIFTLISLLYTLNGILLNMNFKKSVKRQKAKGKPVEGIRGFEEFKASMGNARNYSMLVTLTSAISLAIFVSSLTANFDSLGGVNVVQFKLLVTTLAVTFAFLTISVLFLVEYPEETSFSPGGLIEFYEPDIFPLKLDNLLSDVFITYLDPATYLDIDEWSQDIFDRLLPTFESDETPKTRLERAREKILLLVYLNEYNTDIVSHETMVREIGELVGPDNVDPLMNGETTGLTFSEISRIIRRIEKLSPEPFRLIDRLMIKLTDDYVAFTNDDLYFTVSAKTKQGDVAESSGIIALFMNNTEKADREIVVELVSGEHALHPHHQKVKIRLDPLTDPYPKVQPPIVSSEGEDVLGILSDILQISDAVWFRVKPTGFGFKVVTIQGEEEGGRLVGTTLEIKFTKSITWYAKTYLPKLSGLAGLALPVLQGIIGFR